MTRVGLAWTASVSAVILAGIGHAAAQPEHWRPNAFGAPPRIGDCPVFPADNPWNWDVTEAPVAANSDAILARFADGFLHADFGENPDYGIPYAVIGSDQPADYVTFDEAADESDAGPYPIPPEAPVEAGDDRHVIVVDAEGCWLYELYSAEFDGAGWTAGSGAIFELTSNALRPLGWTSADAAGLPVFAGLARYEEVAEGEIRHALRVTFSRTRRGFILPATHWASDDEDPTLPPMGLRLRLRADFDLSGFHGQALVILEALKRHGLIVADNGSDWFITGAPSPGWVDDDLNQLKRVPGSAFEVIVTGPVVGPGDF